jgi:molybdenum cofactor synthesis domain-containing protein
VGSRRTIPSVTRSAAVLVIGNEILTGKVEEANVVYLARELFALGIVLKRVIVCPDDTDTIARDVNALRASFDYVLTSGGVGPTHDDVTVPAIAKAFGARLVRDAHSERMIRDHFGERTTEGHLRMAEIPEGAELIASERIPWPVLRCENVFVMPGVPEIFRLKFELVRERLVAGAPFHSRALYTWCDEGEIASLLERVEHAHPGVTIGSYPRIGDPEYSVKITFDGGDLAAVTRALEECHAQIPPEKIVRADR